MRFDMPATCSEYTPRFLRLDLSDEVVCGLYSLGPFPGEALVESVSKEECQEYSRPAAIVDSTQVRVPILRLTQGGINDRGSHTSAARADD